MMDTKKIIEIQPLDRRISFIIHVNDICNFKCNYCAAGRSISKEKLELKDFEKIISSIKKIRARGDNRQINIDITGGEPTINNNLVDVVKLFLDIDDLSVQITTNLFRLARFEKELNDIVNIKNIRNLSFNISFHYFGYRNYVDIFVRGIKILLQTNINFTIKFLLPDENIRLSEFIDIQKQVLSKTGITSKHFFYDLITKNGFISDTYSYDILEFFYSKKVSNENGKGGLGIVYSDGSKENLDMFEIRTNGMNKFKGFNCFYISNEYTEINISHRGNITFGPCYTLDTLKYDINDLLNILDGEKKIICSERTCEYGINLKKKISINYKSILKLEKLLVENLKKILTNIELLNVGVSPKKNINFSFRNEKYFIQFYIEKKISSKYFFTKDNLGFYFKIKDDNNIIIKDNDSAKYMPIIRTLLKILIRFHRIYITILN